MAIPSSAMPRTAQFLAAKQQLVEKLAKPELEEVDRDLAKDLAEIDQDVEKTLAELDRTVSIEEKLAEKKEEERKRAEEKKEKKRKKAEEKKEKLKEEKEPEAEKQLREEERKRWRLNLWLLLGILLAAALVTAVLRALPEEGGVLWLITIPPLPTEVGEIASVLAPLLAVAVAIERLLETVFDWWEQSVIAVADIVVKLKAPVGWIQEELLQAYEAAKKAAEVTGIKADEASLKALDAAEQRLAKAEERLLSWVKAPEYVAWKRALSIWVGLLVGLEVAVLSDLGMLHTIGIPAPRILDMLATGLVIGAGPGPMHSLIGMLQGGKDALEKLADLAEGKAVREAAAALRPGTGGPRE